MSSVSWNATPRCRPKRLKRSTASLSDTRCAAERPHQAKSAPVLPSTISCQRLSGRSSRPRASASAMAALVMVASCLVVPDACWGA